MKTSSLVRCGVTSCAGIFTFLTIGCAVFAQPAAQPPAATKDEPKKDEAKPTETPPPEDKKTEEPAAPTTPVGAFQAKNDRWKVVEKRLIEIAGLYGAADETQRAGLKTEYVALLAESEKLLPELRTAAMAAFEAEPNQNAEVTRALIGMVAYDNRRDLYEEALAIARKMIDAKCEEPVLLALAGVAAYRSDDYEAAEKYLTAADKAKRLDPDGKEYLAELPEQKKAWEAEKLIREKEAKADDLPRVKLETNKGTIVIELFENEAPGAVGNFVSLVDRKFYDGLTFHRVLAGFMAQGGDPDGTGGGGPGYNILCECEKPDARMHFRGTLSMAHAGKDTGGSQFFLTFRPTTHLNRRHTAFGRVIEGMDVLAKLQRRDPNAFNPPQPDKIVKAEVLRKRNHEYQPNKAKE